MPARPEPRIRTDAPGLGVPDNLIGPLKSEVPTYPIASMVWYIMAAPPVVPMNFKNERRLTSWLCNASAPLTEGALIQPARPARKLGSLEGRPKCQQAIDNIWSFPNVRR